MTHQQPSREEREQEQLNYEQASQLNQFRALYEKEDWEYLSKSSIHSNFIHDLLNQILVHKPENAVDFVQSHFASRQQ